MRLSSSAEEEMRPRPDGIGDDGNAKDARRTSDGDHGDEASFSSFGSTSSPPPPLSGPPPPPGPTRSDRGSFSSFGSSSLPPPPPGPPPAPGPTRSDLGSFSSFSSFSNRPPTGPPSPSSALDVDDFAGRTATSERSPRDGVGGPDGSGDYDEASDKSDDSSASDDDDDEDDDNEDDDDDGWESSSYGDAVSANEDDCHVLTKEASLVFSKTLVSPAGGDDPAGADSVLRTSASETAGIAASATPTKVADEEPEERAAIGAKDVEPTTEGVQREEDGEIVAPALGAEAASPSRAGAGASNDPNGISPSGEEKQGTEWRDWLPLPSWRDRTGAEATNEEEDKKNEGEEETAVQEQSGRSDSSIDATLQAAAPTNDKGHASGDGMDDTSPNPSSATCLNDTQDLSETSTDSHGTNKSDGPVTSSDAERSNDLIGDEIKIPSDASGCPGLDDEEAGTACIRSVDECGPEAGTIVAVADSEGSSEAAIETGETSLHIPTVEPSASYSQHPAAQMQADFAPSDDQFSCDKWKSTSAADLAAVSTAAKDIAEAIGSDAGSYGRDQNIHDILSSLPQSFRGEANDDADEPKLLLEPTVSGADNAYHESFWEHNYEAAASDVEENSQFENDMSGIEGEPDSAKAPKPPKKRKPEAQWKRNGRFVILLVVFPIALAATAILIRKKKSASSPQAPEASTVGTISNSSILPTVSPTMTMSPTSTYRPTPTVTTSPSVSPVSKFDDVLPGEENTTFGAIDSLVPTAVPTLWLDNNKWNSSDLAITDKNMGTENVTISPQPTVAPSRSSAPSITQSAEPSKPPSTSATPTNSPQPTLAPSQSSVPSMMRSMEPSVSPTISAAPTISPQPSTVPSHSAKPSLRGSFPPSSSVAPTVTAAPTAGPTLSQPPSHSPLPSFRPSSSSSSTAPTLSRPPSPLPVIPSSYDGSKGDGGGYPEGLLFAEFEGVEEEGRERRHQEERPK